MARSLHRWALACPSSLPSSQVRFSSKYIPVHADLPGVYFTGGSLNPARSFGPAVIAHSFNHDHWIYWVGPFIGSIMAVGFYRLVKALEYETVNPSADSVKAPQHFQDDVEVLSVSQNGTATIRA